MKLRITSGYLKGRYIVSPKGGQTRPTSERLRQTAFDIIGDRVVGARFLDLYAGSGAVAFEAISRGASEALLVEKAPLATRAIHEAIDSLDVGDQATLLQRDCKSAVKQLSGRPLFDIGYIDPPYPKCSSEEKQIQDLLTSIAQASIFRSGALILLELDSNHLEIKTWIPSPFKLCHSRKVLSSSLHEIVVE